MLDKESFCKSINEIHNLLEKSDLFEKELNEVFSHFEQTNDTRLFNSFNWDLAFLTLKYIVMSTTNVSEEIANQESSYFMYECDWGNRCGEVEVDGKKYKLDSAESFYDYLNDCYNKDEYGWEGK